MMDSRPETASRRPPRSPRPWSPSADRSMPRHPPPPGAASRTRPDHGRDRVPPGPPERYETWAPGPGSASPEADPEPDHSPACRARPSPPASRRGQRPRQASSHRYRGDPRPRADRAVDSGPQGEAGDGPDDRPSAVGSPEIRRRPGPSAALARRAGSRGFAPSGSRNRDRHSRSGGPGPIRDRPELTWIAVGLHRRRDFAGALAAASEAIRLGPAARRGLHPAGHGLQRRATRPLGPSPTPPRPCGSIRSRLRPTRNGPWPTTMSASPTRPSPTAPRRCGSTRSRSWPTRNEPGSTSPGATRTGPSPTTPRRCGSIRKWPGSSSTGPGPTS